MGRPHGRDGADRARSGQADRRKQATRFKLPERSFDKPLAKALIEQRRVLVLDPERREDVVRLLDALTFWPEDILEESSIYLGVRVARTRLYHARSHDELKTTIALLWDSAWRSRTAMSRRPSGRSMKRARRCSRRSPKVRRRKKSPSS